MNMMEHEKQRKATRILLWEERRKLRAIEAIKFGFHTQHFSQLWLSDLSSDPGVPLALGRRIVVLFNWCHSLTPEITICIRKIFRN